MLLQINKKLEKMMPFITPTGVFLGILFSYYVKDYAFLVPWLFAFMTFEGSLSMRFGSLKGAIAHPLPVIIALAFLHIGMPLWAWGIGHLSFSGDSLTITGIILGMVIPTGVTSFIWVSMKKGNTALTIAIILIDALMAPFIVPFSLSVMIGQQVDLDVINMMKGLFFMIVLPSLMGMALNEITKGKVKDVWKPRLSPLSKLFLGLVVMLNGAVVAPYLKEVNIKLLFIILVVLFISFTGYLFAFLLGKLLNYEKETIISYTFSGGMRNISSGAVIAMAYFPSAVIIPVIVSMLFQQILASTFAAFLDRHYSSQKTEEISKVSV
ncbi:bile acid:sodium symporter family protein [Niallia endozanthoxylica]|uniref:Bile acid:sodium symporter family protein n=1 Tax=Niallia endozanthoxylica TaxID=2036016 RepID=A0A5J5HML6_9BACI|nr:bile acid:sodium symporter family protein [Niallia endozanthoxylica]KAA9021830.1 bile acid:sodium symporter family protein [Niallia endozanthoxylica]